MGQVAGAAAAEGVVIKTDSCGNPKREELLGKRTERAIPAAPSFKHHGSCLLHVLRSGSWHSKGLTGALGKWVFDKLGADRIRALPLVLQWTSQ